MYLKSPYGYWCGVHGCAMAVFRAHARHFTLVNAIRPVRTPVYIATLKSNGWQDLIMRISGRADRAKDVAMRFDGRRYPANPGGLRPFPKKNYNGYTRIFMQN